MSNTDAMEALRKAMQKETHIQGYCQVTIARRIGAPSPSPYQEKCLDYLFQSSEDNSLDNLVAEQNSQRDSKTARNFLIERLTGGSGDGLRNESYAQANHDSFVDGLRNDSYNQANASVNAYLPGMSPHHRPLLSPTLVSHDNRNVIIENNMQVGIQHYCIILRIVSTVEPRLS